MQRTNVINNATALYNCRAWRSAREGFLKKNPLCAEHFKLGKYVEAVVVDHIDPHRGDVKIFWDKKNWQSLCKHCHDSHKQRLEKSGRVIGCSPDGIPIDPSHHWNRPPRWG